MDKEFEKENLTAMLYHAHKCLLYNEMVIEYSGNWLSAEEGNRNMQKAEGRKAEGGKAESRKQKAEGGRDVMIVTL